MIQSDYGRLVPGRPPHVVIVGGGFGGLTAAKALRRKRVRVTLVDRHNHHLFQTLLYQVATAGLSPGDIASPIRWILRRQANTRVLLADAQRVDVAARTLICDVGPIAYDYLILAPGVDPFLLRSRRVARPRAGPEDARRCARDPRAGC